MLLRYFLLNLVLAIAPLTSAVAQHSVKYRNCKKACRAAHETARTECKKKPLAEQQPCIITAKATAAKCKQACNE